MVGSGQLGRQQMRTPSVLTVSSGNFNSASSVTPPSTGAGSSGTGSTSGTSGTSGTNGNAGNGATTAGAIGSAVGGTTMGLVAAALIAVGFTI